MSFSEISNLLKEGKTILYPTDTVWGIGCDPSNPKAVKRIFEIKGRNEKKKCILLVKDIESLKKYVSLSSIQVETILKDTKPTTYIYNRANSIVEHLTSEDGSLAIRVAQKTAVTEKLFENWTNGIISTSANCSGNPSPESFKDIEEAILKGVDYIVTLPYDLPPCSPSRILKWNEQGTETTIIRE